MILATSILYAILTIAGIFVESRLFIHRNFASSSEVVKRFSVRAFCKSMRHN